MIFVYSIRDMFVCSLAKTFGHLSDRAKKTVIDRLLTLEHYISSKVFVSPPRHASGGSLLFPSSIDCSFPGKQFRVGQCPQAIPLAGNRAIDPAALRFRLEDSVFGF